MKTKKLKITESQFKRVIDKIINEQVGMPGLTYSGEGGEVSMVRGGGNKQNVTKTANKVGSTDTTQKVGQKVTQKSGIINWTVKPGSQQLEKFIQTTGLECLRDATFGRNINGKFEFLFNAELNKTEIKFYISEDNQSFVVITEGKDAYTVVTIGGDKKIGYSKCTASGVIEVKTMNGATLLYSFDPKNPIAKKTGLPPAKSEEDLVSGKGKVYSGMRGDLVKKIQQMLKDIGYAIDVDGVYGPGTIKVVKEYQQMSQLKVDGIVGPKTYQSLVEYHKLVMSRKGGESKTVAPSELPKGEAKPLEKASAPGLSPEVKGYGIYTKNKNNITLRRIDNMLLYKGAGLNQQDLNDLTAYLKTIGYEFRAEKVKGEENVKYKWKKV